MNNLFKIGIAVTFVLGVIFSKTNLMHVNNPLSPAAERNFLIELYFIGAALVYFAYVLWKALTQRIWIKIILIPGILFPALVSGYVLTGFILQPLLVSTAWTFRLLANNESNIVWYWPFGFSIATYVLHILTKMFIKIIRGETFLF